MSIKYPNSQIERIVEAASKIRRVDPGTLVRTESFDAISLGALREQVMIDSRKKTIGDDVKELIGENEYHAVVIASYNDQKKTVPESVIAALEARAVQMPAEEG